MLRPRFEFVVVLPQVISYVSSLLAGFSNVAWVSSETVDSCHHSNDELIDQLLIIRPALKLPATRNSEKRPFATEVCQETARDLCALVVEDQRRARPNRLPVVPIYPPHPPP